MFDYFGESVSLSLDATVIAVGAPLNDDNGNNTGQVRVFTTESIGIIENELINFSIFPNPTQGIVYISFPKKTLCKIRIVDILGKTIISKTTSNKKEMIDLSNYKSGLYFFYFEMENKVEVSKVPIA